jgi:hypothetical protein
MPRRGLGRREARRRTEQMRPNDARVPRIGQREPEDIAGIAHAVFWAGYRKTNYPIRAMRAGSRRIK